MKIQLLSDLHLEAHPHWTAQPAPGADVLVLAGDVGSYQNGSLLQDSDFGLGQFSPLNGWPTPVIFVPGNQPGRPVIPESPAAMLEKDLQGGEFFSHIIE